MKSLKKPALLLGGLVALGMMALVIESCTRQLALPTQNSSGSSGSPTNTPSGATATPTSGGGAPTNTPTPAGSPNISATYFATCTQTSTPDLIADEANDSNLLLTNQCRDGSWYAFTDYYSSSTLSSAVTLPTPEAITVVSGETTASDPITLGTATVLNSGTIASGTTIVWGQSTLYDGPGGATQYLPSNSSTPFPMDNVAAQNGSNYCAYIKGVLGPGCSGNDITGGYSECPYVGLGFQFLTPKAAYSISMFNGIIFYAKMDAANTASWRVNIPTTDTNTCSDPFGESFTPTTSWAAVTVGTTGSAAASLTQAYSSSCGSGGFVAADVTDVQWESTSGGATYGLYIGEIMLY